MKKLMALMLGLAVLPCGKVIAGVVFEFDVYSNNGAYSNSEDLTLFVDVSEPQSGRVRFSFSNESSLSSSSVAGVYFDDSLRVIGSPIIDDGKGVKFWHGANPAQLGGGLDFTTTYSLGAQKRPAKDGINSGEYVSVDFTTVPWMSFDDILSAMRSQQIRMGMHVISLPDGSSEWAVNAPISMPVPEPATLALLAIGGLFIARGRKKAA